MSKPNIRTKKRRKWIIAAVVLVAAGAAAFSSLRKGEEIVAVQTEKVIRRNITETVIANGRIQPVLQVVINPEVSGEITELPVKEGQQVKKGDLLVRIKPDNYVASRNSAEANYKSAEAGRQLAKAELEKAELEFGRFKSLFDNKLVSESDYLSAKTAYDVQKARYETSGHQQEQARASLDRAEDDLSKTTILAPIDGTVTKLKSQKGERVVGTAMMAGTEIMTIAQLDKMEARVDIGEMDIVLIAIGQKAKLEVEAFRDKKFLGVVSEIANASKGSAAQQAQNSSQEATKFEVKILITDPESFRPGMSVTAEVETRYKTNVLAVPIMAVTTRMPNGGNQKPKPKEEKPEASTPEKSDRKKEEGPKPQEVVFLLDGDKAKMVPVKFGISDDTHMEITEGLTEGQEIISGGYAAVSRLLEDGKKVKKDSPENRPEKGVDKKS
ncbi:MAG: efflux RND transporter periplasmic adaptor subunit [Verrucomicrobiales bacterium]